MNRRTLKLLTMFTPLTLSLVVLFMGIYDLKHPAVQNDECFVVGRGPAVQNFKQEAELLYQIGDNTANDIGFHCKAMGDVYINDSVPLPFRQGKVTRLTIKEYQYFPKRYYFELPVVNPDDVAASEANSL